MSCSLCAARGDAHFGWCSRVGGPGHKPGQAPPEPVVEPPAPVVGLRALRPVEPIDPAFVRVKAEEGVARRDANLARPKITVVPEGRHANAVASARLRGLADARRPVRWRWVDLASGTMPFDTPHSDDQLVRTAEEMRELCLGGLPVGYHISTEVLAVEGFNEEDISAALREPHRVTVRTGDMLGKDKRYPVLSFRRGDVNVIVGLQTPSNPRVIAAYWTSLLAGYDPSVHRGGSGSTGGGGARRAEGLPNTPSNMVKRLRAMNVEVDPEWQMTDGPVSVSYEGQDLGKITVGARATKTQVQSDYQRIVRKVAAIDQRQAVGR